MLHPADDNMLFMLWLYDLPTWLLGTMVILLWVGVAITGLAFSHRRMHRSDLSNLIDNGTVGWFFSGVSLLYGLLLGLLTVATWNNFSQASGIVSQEAAIIAVVYRDLTGYPQPQQAELKRQLRAYTTSIIKQSWPAQRRGFINDGEAVMLKPFQDTLLNLEPQTQGQLLLHTEAINAFNRMIELRRQRIESIRGSVPGVLWSVVLLGALITIAFSYFFLVTSYRFHAALTGMLAAMIGLLIFLLIVLDHPYWGEVSISADAYQLVLDTVMK